MGRFALCGKLVAHPGKRDELVDILIEAANALGRRSECESYIVSLVEGEPDAVWVAELWANEDAHAQSLQAAEVRALVERGMPLIAGMPEQVRLVPVGGKGLQ